MPLSSSVSNPLYEPIYRNVIHNKYIIFLENLLITKPLLRGDKLHLRVIDVAVPAPEINALRWDER